MKIAIFGSGYVGLVTAACFAKMGNKVIAVDINTQKIAALNQGKIPIYEPGLADLIKDNLKAKRLIFTTNFIEAINSSIILFIAVNTPSQSDGSVELNYVQQVATTIGETIVEYKVVVIKSTVPPGTAELVKSIIKDKLKQRELDINFDIVSNPEFLKEGAAINDFMKPDRVVVGIESDKALKIMKQLYIQFNRNHNRIISMDIRSAEFTKYVANAMLATKISFMNEMSQIAEKINADIESVRIGIGSDPRIGYHFIYPGCGYGGSCFPKDIKGLIYTAQANNYEPQILKAVHNTNEKQKTALFEKITKYFSNKLKNKVFAIWGLAFKPNTDDIRDAPSCVLLQQLLAVGARIQAYDPEAMGNTAKFFAHHERLSFFSSKEEVLNGADALVILTEWAEFRSPEYSLLSSTLKEKIIFDGRNLFDPVEMKNNNLHYICIGRPTVI